MVKKTEWFYDSEFWGYFSPIMFDETHWSEVPEVADGITRLLRFNLYGETASEEWQKPLDSIPKILDLCCGIGRISSELARTGYAVTGVDLTE